MCEMGLDLSDLKNLVFYMDMPCSLMGWLTSTKKKKSNNTGALSLSFLERSDGCFQNTCGQLL